MILFHMIEVFVAFIFCGLGMLTFAVFVCLNSRYWNRHCKELVRASHRASLAPGRLARWLSIYARQYQLTTRLIRWTNRRFISDAMLIFIAFTLVTNLYQMSLLLGDFSVSFLEGVVYVMVGGMQFAA